MSLKNKHNESEKWHSVANRVTFLFIPRVGFIQVDFNECGHEKAMLLEVPGL